MRSHRLLIVTVVASCATLTGVLSGGGQVPASQPAAPPAPAPAQPGKPTAPPGGGVNDKRNRIAEIVATAVEKAHGIDKWRTRSALQADIAMTFGQQTLKGALTFQINGQGIRLQMSDGVTLVSDGKKTWVSPASSTLPAGDAARLLQCSKAFVAAPLILREPGTKQAFYRELPFMGETTDTFRLALNPAVRLVAGPSGWMIGYANQRSHRLMSLANITLPFAVAAVATAPTSAAAAIVYTDMQTIEEITLPSKWTFFAWTEAAGAKGDALGNGEASNLQFVRPAEGLFDRPPDSREDTPPAATQAKPG